MVATNDEESPFDPKSESFADELLQRATRDAAAYAFGTVAVETRVFRKDRLIRVESGTWFDSLALHTKCKGVDCDYCKLTDPLHENHVATVPLAAGVGVPGLLWVQASKAGNSKVSWFNTEAIKNDPDQPFNPRLIVGSKLDLGWTAGVSFSAPGGLRGIVIYWARGGVDVQKLRSPTNETYLVRASNLIAAAYALHKPRRAAMEDRHRLLRRALARVRIKLLALLYLGVSIEKLAQPNPEASLEKKPISSAMVLETLSNPDRIVKGMCSRLGTFAKKLRGANVTPPPVVSWEQSTFSCLSVFLTLFGITKLNTFLKENFGSEYGMSLGPFGALMTLQFGLTAAPASQPRNAILGQATSLVVALAVSRLSSDAYIRQALATALAIIFMLKLGITHPPAGAAALIFSTGDWEWSNMAAMLLGNAVAIGCSAVLNNASPKRQYPTFWGFALLNSMAMSLGSLTTPAPDRQE